MIRVDSFRAALQAAALTISCAIPVPHGAAQNPNLIGPYKELGPSSTFRSFSLLQPRATDFLGQGHLDLVFTTPHVPGPGSSGGGPTILRSDGSGAFQQLGCILSGNPPYTGYGGTVMGLAVGDVNGDGLPDVVAPQFYQQFGNYRFPPMVFLNDQTGIPRYHPGSGLDPFLMESNGAELFDADGDGDLDLYIFTRFAHADFLFLNDGTGHFTDVTLTHMPPLFDETMCVTPVDLDLDGDLDLVLGIRQWAAVILHNDGQGRFSVVQRITWANSVLSIAAGDLDGDGFPDLYLGTEYGQGDVLLRNDRTGRFVDMSHAIPWFATSSASRSVLFHDLDGDRRLELLISSGTGANTPRPTILAHDGRWNFTNISTQVHRTALPMTTNFYWNVITDVDGDGDEDMLIGTGLGDLPGSNSGLGGRILFNLTRQLEVPATTTIGNPLQANAHARAGHTVFPFLGLARGEFTVPGIGRFGLDPTTLWPLPAVSIGATGNTPFGFHVPMDPSLRGVDVFLQGIDVAPSFTLHPTGWTRTRIQ